MILNEDGTVAAEIIAKIMEPPKEYNFTLDDFLGLAPYDEIAKYEGNLFVAQQAINRMAINAAAVGFKGFKSTLNIYMKSRQAEQRSIIVPNQTEFDGPYKELDCGEWHATDWGIYRENIFGNREYACYHPILPVERFVNIDNGEVKLKLAYKRTGGEKKWQTIITDKKAVSSSKTIVDALASTDISVTSETAKFLVAYLNDVQNINYDVISERKSIGRLGYIEGEGFSPYVEDLVFDGDASFKNLYSCVKPKGSYTEWYQIALECRKMSVTARILLAASFASPLLSIVGSLPFFVHLWGVDSGTGKTVALMLAASVWGNPAVGSYVQTFNGTQVGQERTAAFLNHLPMCLDELQLTKNSKGQSNFDVYQLAQGVGRARGTKTGGVDKVPTWSCCFLTTGESPITSGAAGAGAVNRVIDIECTAGTVAVRNGHRVAGVLKSNYGYAGEDFISRLYDPDGLDDRLNQIRDLYQDIFRELCAGDSTEKQAMAAAAVLTADFLATQWIFKDDSALTVEEIQKFLASREAVSAGHRAYEWLCDWVAANANRFYSEMSPTNGDTYGIIENNSAYINRGVFNRVIQEAGFSGSAVLSYLRSTGKIETSGRKYTRCKRVNGVRTECVVLRLPTDADDTDDFDDLPL